MRPARAASSSAAAPVARALPERFLRGHRRLTAARDAAEVLTRRLADEDLRHCLTVVSGYLGLLVEEGPGPVGPDHWVWLERAREAADRAVALCDADAALSASTPPVSAPE